MLDRRTILALSGAALLPNTRAAWAQQPALAKIICGFPAGGTVDTTSRRLAESWRGRLAEAVLVENRVGAGGRIAINAVKDAPADGLTVLISPDSMFTLYPSIYRKLGYDPDRDLAAVSSLCSLTFALGIGPGVPTEIATLADFTAWAKANARSLTFGSPAAGSMPHFLGDQYFRAIGVAARHNPYRGSAPALQDLAGGHIPAVLTVLGDFLPFKATPGLRMLAVTDRTRSRFLPDTPTFPELGFPQIVGVESYGAFLPGRAPAELVSRAHAMLGEAVDSAGFAEALGRSGLEPAVVATSDYRARLAAERAAWAPIIAASGFSLDE